MAGAWPRARDKVAVVTPGAAPVFVVGAPRSGTTLLYRCLALHPDAAWISSVQARFPRAWGLAALNRVTRHTPRLTYAAWFGPRGDAAYRYGSPRPLRDRLWPQPVEGEPVFAACGIPATWTGGKVSDRQRRLPVLIARTCRAGGGAVFVGKRIGHNRRLLLLDALWPNARFVVLTRDGRAVTESLLRVDWWPEAELWWWRAGARPADWTAAGGAPRVAAARHWVAEVDAIAEGLRGIPPGRVWHLSYEDLVADPRTHLSAVARFAGLDPGEASWQRSLSAVDFRNRHRAAGDAGDPSRADVLAVLAPRLENLGYLP